MKDVVNSQQLLSSVPTSVPVKSKFERMPSKRAAELLCMAAGSSPENVNKTIKQSRIQMLFIEKWKQLSSSRP